MNKDNVKVNGLKILTSLHKKYINEPWVLSRKQVNDKIHGFFSGKWDRLSFLSGSVFGLKSGLVLDRWDDPNLYLLHKKKLFTIYGLRSISLNDLNYVFHIHDSSSIKLVEGGYKEFILKMTEPEIKFLKEFLDKFSKEVDKEFNSQKKKKEQQKNKEKQRIKSLKKSQSSLLDEFDKDGNGVIDVIEGSDDFMKLFRKHQSIIKEFDKNYINNLVKISNYLKIKRKNIQQIFTEISNTKNQTELENNVGLLKNQIHTYKSVLYHSFQLINSIVQDDLITVNEIYEEFDRLKMFKSDHEREVSEKLSDIKEGLSNLMYSINTMEKNMVSGLNNLSYMTGEGFKNLNSSLTKELKSIQSGIGFNNLLTGIQTYQLYKINKNTKSLRS
tara:strand:+ start:111 stop:1268 length:1158 start_codon:yes stop_codon:yes gene_type:complete